MIGVEGSGVCTSPCLPDLVAALSCHFRQPRLGFVMGHPIRTSLAALVILTSLVVAVEPHQVSSDFFTTLPTQGNHVQVTQFEQPILKRVPLWAGFMDSVWTLWDAKLLDPSTILIVDRRASRLLVVDGENEDVRAIGRRGEGPGEFKAPAAVGVGSESFYVWDMTAMRFSAFERSGLFMNSLPLVIPSRGALSSICITDWGDVALKPWMVKTGNKYFGQILYFTADLDSFWTVDLLCSRLLGKGAEPTDPACCDVSLAAGLQETMLVAFHNDYTIRRYSRSGEILWDSGRLDPLFKPAWVEMIGEHSYRFHMYNMITCLIDIDNEGILAGSWILVGDPPEARTVSHLDVIVPGKGLVGRVPIPEETVVKDIVVDEDQVLLLTAMSAVDELPRLTLYSASLKALFRK